MFRRSHRRDDTGASLILVLIVVTVISVSMAALLSLTDTSIRTTVNLRGQAANVYDADGAVQAAITNIGNSAYNAAPGSHCFGGAADTLQVPFGADSAAVTCAPDPKKVMIQCPSLAQCNRPGNAILTLGRVPGEDGLNIQQPTGSAFRVHGIVFSNSNINVVNGSLNTNTRVYARGACAGTVQSTPAPFCNYGNTANALGDDPGYAPAVSQPPAHQSLPACTIPNSVVAFQPGYYDDAKGLSDIMAGGSSKCHDSTWWFKPGTYYFDFHNAGANRIPWMDSNGGNVWTVNNGYLVAGTPVNAAGVVQAKPPVPAVIPGSCDNPINDPNAVGVQFIFGGDSQLAVKAGQAEICGTYSATKAPVAVYGLTSGTDTQTDLKGAGTLKPAAVTGAGSFSNATAASLATGGDNAFASWKSGHHNDSATLTVNGYAPPAAAPAGSLLTSAVVRVVHRHSDTGSTDSLGVALTPSGGTTPVSGTVTGHAGGSAFQTDTVTLDAAATGALAQAVYAGTFTGATIAVTANLSANNDTEDIDAIQFDLSYVPPAFRAGTGCITAKPYTGTGSSACALVTAQNFSGNQFYIQGTTYAPGAVLDVTLNNAAEQIFRFGVIARSVWIKETGSFAYTGVVIEVPDDSPGFVFSVYLTAYVCERTTTCTTASGTVRLRAKVAFVDADPVTPVPGHRQVSVLSWSSPG